MFDLDQILVYAQPNEIFIESLSNKSSSYIIGPFSSSFVQNTSLLHMADQYGLTPEDYIDDLKRLSNNRYGQGMLFLILSSSKQQLKPFQVIIASLMAYDFIYHIPQQVRLSICNLMIPHISSLPDSVPP